MNSFWRDKMRWRKWQIAFWFVTLSFLITLVVASTYVIPILRIQGSIPIFIFERVNRLPNDFVLHAVRSYEVNFKRNEERIAIGRMNTAFESGSMENLKKHQLNEIQKCGVSVVTAQVGDAKVVLLYDSSDYMVFASVTQRTIDDWINALCDSGSV